MSQSNQNPFQAPIKSVVKNKPVLGNSEVLDFISLAKKWEKYRVIYNAVLVFETVGLSLLLLLVGVPFWADVIGLAIIGAFVCNFFFLLGPVLDGYCQWIFKSRNQAYGLAILILGTLFSALLAAGTVLGSFI